MHSSEGYCGMDSGGWLWMRDGMARGLEVEGACLPVEDGWLLHWRRVIAE